MSCFLSYLLLVYLFIVFFFLMIRRPPTSTRTDTLFPYTTLFRSPSDKRAIVLATGGLSHWINIERHGQVNAAFDEQVIAQLETGQLAPLVAMSSPELRENAGNGGLEIVNWIAVATIAGRHGLRGEKIYYEPMTHWMTGMGGMAFT